MDPTHEMTTEATQQLKGSFDELSRSECLELLGVKRVGRVAICGDEGPQVFPVNYVMDDERILFRTAPHTRVATVLRGAPAAFEVDDIDDFLQCGWSVLVSGRASQITNAAERLGDPVVDPEPWAAGARTLLIGIDAERITGRRVHPA